MDERLKSECEVMRDASGQVTDTRRLVAFLYVLMNNHLTPGAVEDIMHSHVEAVEPGVERAYTNGWLTKHAQDIAKRLRDD
jgi:hypothetical protein